jgi:hypothetical protein
MSTVVVSSPAPGVGSSAVGGRLTPRRRFGGRSGGCRCGRRLVPDALELGLGLLLAHLRRCFLARVHRHPGVRAALYARGDRRPAAREGRCAGQSRQARQTGERAVAELLLEGGDEIGPAGVVVCTRRLDTRGRSGVRRLVRVGS